jgi:hypothetical protein
MHFDILIEDPSGKKMLKALVLKLIDKDDTFRIEHFKSVGNVPPGLADVKDPKRRMLLDQLPKYLRAYGKNYKDNPAGSPAAVIVVCDLDKKCLKKFRAALDDVLKTCNPNLKPETRFCIAVEEGEAWLLGDLAAVKAAYPRAKDNVLNAYVNDSICGTWEKLADAVYPGGAAKLKKEGWQAAGREKYEWAKNISPHMDVKKNQSPSFNYFRGKLGELAGVLIRIT